jgi:hypothetical protein
MLDEFLDTVYTHQVRKQAEYEMVGLLKDIPTLELKKLAAGTPVAELYEKQAFGDCAPSTDDAPKTFLDKFKDTPLFDEALALEQENLEAEAANIQARMQRRGEDQLYQVQDQIRLKKRLLELKLAKLQAGGQDPAAAAGAPPPPGEPAQGAGAPGPVPAEGVQDSSQGLGGGVAKSASVKKTASELVQFSDAFARALARADFEKAARVEVLLKTGSVAGELMAKSAGLGTMIGQSLNGGTLGRAAGWALKHPSAAGSIVGGTVGAAGGALAGGPEHRLSGAIGGAALGAGVGHAAGGIGSGMLAGQGLGQAAKSYGGGVLQKAKGMMPGAGAAPSGPAPIRKRRPGQGNALSMPTVPDMR